MSLAKGLASAFDTFTTIRDENRRSQLHELKTENYGLRNEGRQIENKFARQSFGARLRQEEGNAEFETGRGRKAQSEAYVAEQTEDDLIQQQEEITRYQGNRANYWGSQATSAASDARVDLATEDDRIGKIQAQAIKADEEAQQAGIDTVEKSRGHYQDRLVNAAGDRTLRAATQDDGFQGLAVAHLESEYDEYLKPGQRVAGIVPQTDGPGYTIATIMPDGSTKPISVGRGTDDPALVVSEEEASEVLFGESAPDYVRRGHQARALEAESGAQQQAVAAQGERTMETAEDRIANDSELFEQHKEIQPTLSQLRQERDELRQQLDGAQERSRAIGDNRGRMVGAGGTAEIEEELAAVESNLAALEDSYGGAVDMTPERYAQATAGNTTTLAETPGRVEASQRQTALQHREMEAAIAAGEVTRPDALSNFQETGNYRVSREDMQARRDDRTERVRKISDRVIESIEGIEHFEEESIDAGVLRGDLMDAIHQEPAFADMLFADESRLEAGLTIAAAGMAQEGKDKGIQTFLLQGKYNGNPELAYKVQGAPELERMPDSVRFIAGNLAGKLSRQGHSDVEARREALRLVQSGGINTRAAMNKWLERQSGGRPASMSQLQN